MTKDDLIREALEVAVKFGGTDESHHKSWVIDQMVRALTGCPRIETQGLDVNGRPYTFTDRGESAEYLELVRQAREGEDGPETYAWDHGVPP